MKIVLLPGLDGTGQFFAPLIEQLPGHLTYSVISYPVDRELGYNELVDHVLQRLPVNEPYILLGESFSGPVAYQVAQRSPPGLQSVVLVATFLANPRPVLLRLLCMLPLACLLRIPVPLFILRWFILGRYSNDELLHQIRHVVSQVSPSVLAFRLREVNRLALPKATLNMNMTYIQASEDRIVLPGSFSRLQEHCVGIKHYIVSGPHAILQANPVHCAAILSGILSASCIDG